ncbi:MAG: histidine kinase [Bacteroidetes bacterium]|nr:histidine kinase [Bacteroidota bacterium]
MEKLKIGFNKLLFFLLKPFMLALYLWAIVWYFVPNYFEKYKTEIVETEPLQENSKLYYHDLDGDGISENVRSLNNQGGETPAILYFDKNGSIINQWNLRGKRLLNQKLFFGDYNHNGYKEVYCITRVGDSLFLNAKELLFANGLEFENRFICQTKMFKGDNVDTFIIDARTMDVNNDRKDEFVFTLWSGFSNYPRNTFVYDITNGIVTKSPLSASGFTMRLQFMDINGDGVDEITGNINAVDNIHYEMPYTDSCSWLMVLNLADSLSFLFPPIKYEGVFGGLSPVFYTIEGEKYIVTTFSCGSAGNETNGNVLQIFNSNGNLINKRLVPIDEYGVLTIINPLNGDKKNIYLINEHGVVFTSDISQNIHLLSNPNIEGLIINMNKSSRLDIDGNGENEILFIATRPSPDKLIIYRSNLEESTFIDLPESKQTLDWHVTLKQNPGKSPVIILQAESIIYYIQYSKSKYYLLKYPAYVGVYFLLFVIFWLLQKGQNKLAQQRFETERHLIRQQLAISKNQLEPHFMLNTLNNIGYMFSKENKDDAQYYFGRFASLIHRGLKYADQVETSLHEELEFVRDYLILQKQRFEDDLETTIEAEDEIDLNTIKIPHSLIFTFVENAVKHGLRHKSDNRKLSIYISKSKSKIEIVITDNGIGRKQSKVMKTTGTGKGLGIVANIVEGYNKLYSHSISYVVKDLVDGSGKGVGTEVRVVV